MISENPIEIVGEFMSQLKPEQIDGAEKACLREHQPYIDPIYYATIFKIGLALLRSSTPKRFTEVSNPLVKPYEKDSPELNLVNLVNSYSTKILALRKIQSRGLDPDASHLVKVNGSLINAAERTFQTNTKDIEGVLKTNAPIFRPDKRLYLCKGYVDGLYTDTLPLIEVASQPVINAGEYVLSRIKELGGPTIAFQNPEEN